jgi:peptide/nickel transport system permease protein
MSEENPPLEEMKSVSINRMVWSRFLKHRPAVIGSVALIVIVFMIAAAPLIAPYSPTTSFYTPGVDKQLYKPRQPPSAQHLLGTDEQGRDLFTRILYGGQISLSVGIIAMTIAVVIGSLIGLLAGYYGGQTDNVLMRITDIFLSFPRLFVLILITTLLRQVNLPGLQPGSFVSIALVIGILAWMSLARIVRGSTLEMREREFVQAAVMIGARNRRIMFRHILPNVASPIIVAATLGLSAAIIAESGLSFLGFGVQLPTATWGTMLRNAQSEMTTAPWIAIYPGLMIFIVVIAVNYIGDGLRDALDPRHFKGGK